MAEDEPEYKYNTLNMDCTARSPSSALERPDDKFLHGLAIVPWT